jgi:hypothetical protein
METVTELKVRNDLIHAERKLRNAAAFLRRQARLLGDAAQEIEERADDMHRKYEGD